MNMNTRVVTWQECNRSAIDTTRVTRIFLKIQFYLKRCKQTTKKDVVVYQKNNNEDIFIFNIIMSRNECKRSRNVCDYSESFPDSKMTRNGDYLISSEAAAAGRLDGKSPKALLKPAYISKEYEQHSNPFYTTTNQTQCDHFERYNSSPSSFIKYKNREKKTVSRYFDNSSSAKNRTTQSGRYSLSPVAQPKDSCSDYFCDQKYPLHKEGREIRFQLSKVGLRNIGNTCFMNAILQCLLHCNDIATFFIHCYTENHICRNSPLKGSLARSFARLCRQIYDLDDDKIDINPAEIKNTIAQWAVQFDGYEQQDAHELLRFLVDGLGEDLKSHQEEMTEPKSSKELESICAIEQGCYFWTRHLAKNSSFITESFCGQFRSTVTCLACGREKYCFDPFYDLSLPLPRDSIASSLRRRINRTTRSTDECSLSDCLHSFVNEEEISEETDCPWCKKRQACKRSLRIERAPRILVLHFKRFNNSRRKKNTQVSFPLSDLDFSPFVNSENNNNGSKSKPLLYQLFAICHHSGSINSGHYIA